MTTVQLVVAGTRTYCNEAEIFARLDKYWQRCKDAGVELIIIEGEARGPDLISRKWAESRGVPFRPYPADWDEYGKGAGFIRNEEMAKVGTHVLAFWDGVSHGTNDMIERGLKYQRRVLVIPVIVEPKK